MHNIEQLRSWIGAHEFNPLAKNPFIETVEVDSRRIKSNGLFFAIKGESAQSRDGHEFLFEAKACGAVIICIEQSFAGPIPCGMGVLKVVDTLASLQLLARNYLMHCNAKVVAITGSIGKTTTTQLLAQIASPHLDMAYTRDSQNGRIGVPLTILNHLKPHHQWIALEMGMDRPGQLALLAHLAPPTLAVITAIELVHMENFSSLRKVAQAKGEILLSTTLEVALINNDSNCRDQLIAMGGCLKKMFSTKSNPASGFGADHSGDLVTFCEDQKVMMRLNYPPMLGPQHLSCLTAAVALARLMSLTPEQIYMGWAQLRPAEGRFCIYRKDDFTLVDDSYNASPASMLASLSALCKPAIGGRRLAILAPMEELGEYGKAAHLEVGRSAFFHLDGVICFKAMDQLIAPAWRADRKPLWRANSIDEILCILQRELSPLDLLLVKGSRKWRLERIVDLILKHFLSP